MTGRRFQLKRTTGFFAAGEEFGRALQLLGDGAFRLFAWVCLHAERASGRLAFDRQEVAQSLDRSRRTVGRHLGELVQAGICELEPSPNQHRRSVLRVREAFWPYSEAQAVGDRPAETTIAEGSGGPAEVLPAEEEAYLASVREALLRPVCVQASFGAGDERLASSWYRAGVPLQDVQRAILLGSTRRSMAMINRQSTQSVASLRYFENVLREVQESHWPQSYWKHMERHLRKCEDYWKQHPNHAPGGAWPDLSQAVAIQASSGPLPPSSGKEDTG